MTQHAESYSSELQIAESLMQADPQTVRHTFHKMDKEALLVFAENMINTPLEEDSQAIFDALLSAFDQCLDRERPQQIKDWVESGKEVRDFVPPHDPLKNRLQEAVEAFKAKREDQRKKALAERLENLKQKQAILAQIQSLSEAEETESSLGEMRELMRRWKEIRHIPQEHQEELYSSYKVAVDRFYDNLSMFIELKDLDREKNLEVKIELIKRTEALKEENSVRKAMVGLNKIHEEWKNTGPVRKEISEEIWNRFKMASDAIIQLKKAQQAEIDAERMSNYQQKMLLVEKAETALTALPSTPREWSQVSKQLDELMESWKTIGPVPAEHNEEIWKRFQTARNGFYTERKQFFKQLDSVREENLIAKLKLCVEAESLQDSTEFQKTADLLQALQDKWKVIGPVPEEHNEGIWNRFRAAFDNFYSRRKVWMSERKEQESGAVELKEAVLGKLEALRETTDNQAMFAELKKLQKEWNESGFVSGKKFHSLNNKYRALCDELFGRYREEAQQNRRNQFKSSIDRMAKGPNAASTMNMEERKLRDRISKVKEEILTIENNKNFFALSKNADAVLKQFDEKIAQLQSQLDKLTEEASMLKQARSQHAS